MPLRFRDFYMLTPFLFSNSIVKESLSISERKTEQQVLKRMAFLQANNLIHMDLPYPFIFLREW